MPRRDVSMTSNEIDEFLQTPRVGVLATIGRDGAPHLSGMWFVPSEGTLRMWTYGKSQKAVNARRDPRSSLLVEEGVGYSELKGLSASGNLRLLDDFEQVRAIGIELYERYTEPQVGYPAKGDVLVEIERQARKRVGLVLDIADIASWDHSKLS